MEAFEAELFCLPFYLHPYLKILGAFMSAKNAIKVALENLDAEGVVPEEVTVVEGELEQEVLEVVEAQQEVEVEAEVVERLETAADSLESYGIALEGLLATGGMNKTTAAVYRIGFEHIMNGLGQDEVRMPALESFEGETDMVEATEVSVEGIKEELTKIYAAIKSFVNSLIEKVGAFFKALFSATASLKKSAVALKKQAGETKGTAGDAKVMVPKALSYKGKHGITDVIAGLGATSSTVEKLFSGVEGAAKKYYEEVKTAAADVLAGKDATVSLTSAVDAIKGMKDEMSGGKQVSVTPTTGKVELVDVTATAGEIDVPSLGDVSKLAGEVEAVVASIEKKKSVVENIKKYQKDAMAAADEIVKKAGTGKITEFRNKSKINGVLNAVRKNFAVVLQSAAGNSIKSAHAALKLGKASLGKYKEVAAA